MEYQIATNRRFTYNQNPVDYVVCGNSTAEKKQADIAAAAFQPCTAIEILNQKYKVSFESAISNYLETERDQLQSSGILKNSQTIRLLSYAYRFTRSRIQQPTYGTVVDFIVRAKLTDEKNRRANADFCLRFLFDLRVCEHACYGPKVYLEGHFEDTILPKYSIATNDYLLPILYSKDYEIIAHDMLKQYFPEMNTAISQTGFIMKAEELADRMGLKICDVHFSDPSIMGQIYYDFGEVKLLDENGKPYIIRVNPCTILVSKDNCYTEAIRNSTIVHECCHMYLDRWFFLLQMMTGKPYAAYTSRRREKKKYHTNSALDWMELQCEKLPAYLLLEQKGTKAFIDKQLATDKTSNRLQHIIAALADRNKVSRSMAKYRMNELGYNSVEGISCYVDDMRIPDHRCSGNWPEGVTFTVSAMDVAAICKDVSRIGEKLRSGEYVYVEGHICMNNKKFLQYDRKGQVYMTAYARTHIDECCLGFQTRGRYANASFSAGVAHRNTTDPVTDKYLPSYQLASDPGTDGYKKENNIFAEDTFLWGQVSAELKSNPELNDDFNQAIKYLMKIKGITVENMALEMDVDRKTLYNARNNVRPKLGEVIAICVALKLPYYISENLIDIARCVLHNTDEDMLYRAFLLSAEKLTVSRCNEILKEYRMEPLIGDSEGMDLQPAGKDDKPDRNAKPDKKPVTGKRSFAGA